MRVKRPQLTESYFGRDYLHIACPKCGNDYVHEGSPEVLKGEDSYKAWLGRGNAIRIPFTCEHDHEFDLMLGHHKGNTHLFMEYEDE